MEPSAIPIVKLVENGDQLYELDEEALKKILLNPVIKDKKVTIISVVGAFRKGKSFLLNFFVLYLKRLAQDSHMPSNQKDWLTENTLLDYFPWRSGSERDTCGILLWSQPFIFNDKHGNEIAVLLMDTQGTFDANSTMKECATIFALSTMISSFQIYNISQAIQEDYLQHLRLFIEYGSLAMEETDHKPFQTLLFLIRDWQCSAEYSYGYTGGTMYLDQVLKKSYRQKKELQELRKEIRSYFEELKCFLLPHPGLEVSNNHNLKRVGKLEAGFKREICSLVQSIFDPKNLVTKEINGQQITCKQLIYYFKAYMNVFNSEKLPKPMSILEATGKANNTMAVAEAKIVYETEMKKVMDSNLTDMNILIQKHETAKNKALRMFLNAPKMGSEELSRKYRDILMNEIQARYIEMVDIVKEKAKIEKERKEQMRRKKELEEEQNRANKELERKRLEQKRIWRMEQEKLQNERIEQERRLEQQRKEAQEEADRQAQAQKAEEEKLEKKKKEIEEFKRKAEQEDQERRARAQREEKEDFNKMFNRLLISAASGPPCPPPVNYCGINPIQMQMSGGSNFGGYGEGYGGFGGGGTGFGGCYGGGRGGFSGGGGISRASTPSSSGGVTYGIDKRGIGHFRNEKGQFCKRPDDWNS